MSFEFAIIILAKPLKSFCPTAAAFTSFGSGSGSENGTTRLKEKVVFEILMR